MRKKLFSTPMIHSDLSLPLALRFYSILWVSNFTIKAISYIQRTSSLNLWFRIAFGIFILFHHSQVIVQLSNSMSSIYMHCIQPEIIFMSQESAVWQYYRCYNIVTEIKISIQQNCLCLPGFCGCKWTMLLSWYRCGGPIVQFSSSISPEY